MIQPICSLCPILSHLAVQRSAAAQVRVRHDCGPERLRVKPADWPSSVVVVRWSAGFGAQNTRLTRSAMAGACAAKAFDLSDYIVDVGDNKILEVVPSFGLVANVYRTGSGEDRTMWSGQTFEHPVCCGLL